jgi:hypothetical protein
MCTPTIAFQSYADFKARSDALLDGLQLLLGQSAAELLDPHSMRLSAHFRKVWLERAPLEIIAKLCKNGEVPLFWAGCIAERCFQTMDAMVAFSSRPFEMLQVQLDMELLRVRIVEYVSLGLRRLFGKLGVHSILHELCVQNLGSTHEAPSKKPLYVRLIAPFQTFSHFKQGLEALEDKYVELVSRQILHGDLHASCARYMGLTLRTRHILRREGLGLMLAFTRMSAQDFCAQMSECVVDVLEAACYTLVKVYYSRNIAMAWDSEEAKGMMALFLSEVVRRFFHEFCCCEREDMMALPLVLLLSSSFKKLQLLYMPIYCFHKFEHDALLMRLAMRRRQGGLFALLSRDTLLNILRHYKEILNDAGGFDCVSFLLANGK